MDATITDVESPPARRRFRIALPLAAAAAAAPALPLGIVYWLRPDSCAALTVWPAWAWALPGLLLALASFRRRRARPSLFLALTWAVFVAAVAEEPKSLLRFNRLDSDEWRAAAREGRAVRVVSLNCAGGSVDAMREVAALHPDIVLLQESPTVEQVTAFARELFGPTGGVEVGFDASVLAKGPLTPARIPIGRRAWSVQAVVHLPGKPPLQVVSLRLTPACVRTDLYAPSCWRDHSENRRIRREQLRAVVESLSATGDGGAVILGGDFNAPQDDAVVDLLRPSLRDAFKTAGSGWGDTIINEAPVLRIDQIWTSPGIRPAAVVARRTVNSDHRMVVADLIQKPEQGTGGPPANEAP